MQLTSLRGLVQGAADYAVEAVEAVSPSLLFSPTPCPRWDLFMLLLHMNDSIDTLVQAVETGWVDFEPDSSWCRATGSHGGEPASMLVSGFRMRSARLAQPRMIGTPASLEGGRAVGRIPVAPEAAAIIGAVEMIAHGWDVSVTCGSELPIPSGLATEMLPLSMRVVESARCARAFTAPVAVPPQASPGDQLLAYLGRSRSLSSPAPGNGPASLESPGNRTTVPFGNRLWLRARPPPDGPEQPRYVMPASCS
jgi:uncharacterized protein (TIGR03086 family)